jgi:hypothetical protein
MRKSCLYIGIAAVLIALLVSPVGAWDGATWKNPTHPTHSFITEYAINGLKARYPEADKYREDLLNGANLEMHELEISSDWYIKKYKVDVEERRKNRYLGTNPGCECPNLIWKDARAAYKAGNKNVAFFLLGILFHEIQDMAVPAHAHNIYHQGNPIQCDNLEFMALTNWKPDFSVISTKDPALQDKSKYADPSAYYEFSKAWCLKEAPNYKSRSEFSKTWALASKDERALLSKRQASACVLTKWALESALVAFAKKPAPVTAYVLREPSKPWWTNQANLKYVISPMGGKYPVIGNPTPTHLKYGNPYYYTEIDVNQDGFTVTKHQENPGHAPIPDSPDVIYDVTARFDLLPRPPAILQLGETLTLKLSGTITGGSKPDGVSEYHGRAMIPAELSSQWIGLDPGCKDGDATVGWVMSGADGKWSYTQSAAAICKWTTKRTADSSGFCIFVAIEGGSPFFYYYDRKTISSAEADKLSAE